MKQVQIIFLMLFLFVACDKDDPIADDLSSSFTNDDGGWRIIGDAQGIEVIPEYNEEGGVIGGHICATDNVTGGVWFFLAPSAYHGDKSVAYDNVISFSLKQSNLNAQFDSEDVIIGSTNLSIVFDTAINPDTIWTNYEIPLNANAGWLLNDLNGEAANEADIRAVLSNITEFRIRGEFVTGSDIGCLDHVDFPGVKE